MYEHEREHERDGEARARMLIVGLESIEARIAWLVTRDKARSRWHFPGRFLLTVILALCITERLSLEVCGTTSTFALHELLRFEIPRRVVSSLVDRNIYTHFGMEMSQATP